MHESERSQQQERSLEELVEQYLANCASGKTSARDGAVGDIRQWMAQSSMREALVRRRLKEQKEEYREEYPEIKKRNALLPVAQPADDSEAVAALYKMLFQDTT